MIPQPHFDPSRIEGRAPARPGSVGSLRRAVAALARRAGFDADRVDDIELAVSEVLTNAVMHAYADRPTVGDLELSARLDEAALHVDVRDQGAGFRRRDDSPGLGLGLALAAMLSDDVRIAPARPHGTVVSLRFDRAQAAGQ